MEEEVGGVGVSEEELTVSYFYRLGALNAPDVHFDLGHEEWRQIIDAHFALNLLHTLAFLLTKEELLGHRGTRRSLLSSPIASWLTVLILAAISECRHI